MPHLLYIIFAFALGSCVGSFLNVVVWRLPRVEPVEGDGLFRDFFRSWQALSYPPSHCPKCGNTLKWYDNIPVFGWLKLAGRCRFCKEPISPRYPIVEATTGLLFVFYYVMFFMAGNGPGIAWHSPMGLQYLQADLLITEHWPIYLLDMILLGALIAATLIDAELFIIPLQIPWFVVPFAFAEHAIWDRPGWPGALNTSATAGALAAGSGLGVLISFVLWWRHILPTSFADGGPLLEVEKARLTETDTPPEREYSSAEVRAEMRKEMLFLFPPLALGLLWMLLTWKIPSLSNGWISIVSIGWVGGLLGSILGLLVGGFVVWMARILGSYGFGREAMGLGDVHLMAAVGATLGPGPATVAFFIAPFFGILRAISMLFTRKSRELPFGPYLSVATAVVMVFYCPIANYLAPGLSGLFMLISEYLGKLF
ncbi:MAG TPA: prepilin peptidase [Tepidisphaeraceae bacterium]|jgi:leader peptidase (prepilin peptidase)/N-methyltransferase